MCGKLPTIRVVINSILLMNLKDLENLEPAKFAKRLSIMKYHKIMKHVNLFTMANSTRSSWLQ
jgi:hypothetical protein